MALTAFIRLTEVITSHASRYFKTKSTQYQDFLPYNFDATANHTSPLAQIYLSSKWNNEVFTLKEILQQPDKAHFVEARGGEVSSMFRHKIWKLVSKS